MLAAFYCVLGAHALGGDAEFRLLGVLPGGQPSSIPYGTSAFGAVVVGQSQGPNGTEAFRWDVQRGMVGLGDLPGGEFFSQAFRVSEDGRVIAGDSITDRGYRSWQLIEGTITELPLPPMPILSTYLGGMSPSGRFKVGTLGLNPVGGASVIWDALRPRVLTFSGAPVSVGVPNGVTDDARIVIGISSFGRSSPLAYRAVDGYAEYLGDLPGGRTESYTTDMTPDGRIVVGEGFEGVMDSRAFFWTRERGLVPLENSLAGDRPAGAAAITADGWVVIGVLTAGFSQTSFLWNPIDGTRPLVEILEDDYGLSLGGIRLYYPTDISLDGTAIVGLARTPEGNLAFLARIPPFCYADCDRATGRGVLDVFDFVEFQRRFALQDLYSDCDQNAQYDIFDYLCFLNHFAAGCP